MQVAFYPRKFQRPLSWGHFFLDIIFINYIKIEMIFFSAEIIFKRMLVKRSNDQISYYEVDVAFPVEDLEFPGETLIGRSVLDHITESEALASLPLNV